MARRRELPRGMIVRPGRQGYYASFTIHGQRHREFLAEDFAVACEILDELRARARRQQHGLADNNYPLAKLQEQYLAHCQQALDASTVTSYTRWLGTILAGLGPGITRVSQVTLPAVVAFRQRRLDAGLSGNSINSEVGALSTMLAWGVHPAKLIAHNPLDGIEPLPHKPKEGRPLTEGEVPRLLEASPEHWRRIWYTFLVTGLRSGELSGLELTAECLDWIGREVIVPDWLAKSGRARRIPMTEALYDILRQAEAEAPHRLPRRVHGYCPAPDRVSTHHVFVGRSGVVLNRSVIWQALARCLRLAGIERQTFGPDGRLLQHVDVHSLRRTFATHLIVSGVDPKTAQTLLGHRTLAMTMNIYASVKGLTSRRDAIDRLPFA